MALLIIKDQADLAAAIHRAVEGADDLTGLTEQVARIQTLQDAGYLTDAKGFAVRLLNGDEYVVKVQKGRVR